MEKLKPSEQCINRLELKIAMLRQGYTNEDLARYLGISRQNLFVKMAECGYFNETQIRKLKIKFGDEIFF